MRAAVETNREEGTALWTEGDDLVITNDPWMASGHLIDISVAAPIYQGSRLVGYTLCIVHHLDMGTDESEAMAVSLLRSVK